MNKSDLITRCCVCKIIKDHTGKWNNKIKIKFNSKIISDTYCPLHFIKAQIENEIFTLEVEKMAIQNVYYNSEDIKQRELLFAEKMILSQRINDLRKVLA